MKATFENSVNVLVKAYFKDTLEHGNYCGISLLKKVKTNPFESQYNWAENVHGFHGSEWYGYSEFDQISRDGLRQINFTGYTFAEIVDIEAAFESTRFNDGDAKLEGLLKCVDVLADIHGIDLKAKEDAKLMFVKA